MQQAKHGEVGKIVRKVTKTKTLWSYTDKLKNSRKYKYVIDKISDKKLNKIRKKLTKRGYTGVVVENYTATDIMRYHNYNKLIVTIPF